MEQKHETVTELFELLNPLRTQERCYYDFKRICEKIDALLRKRHAEETDPENKITYLQAFYRLSHTIGKEVGFIESHQQRMHKKNAARIRADEYYEAVENAHTQVHVDIMMVLMEERK